MRSLRSALLLAMLLVMAVGVAPPASALDGGCSENGNYEVCFTYGAGTEDRLLAAKVKAKIDATSDASAADPDGTYYVRVALYAWGTDGGGTAVANSLARAARNGVSVRIVIGSAAQEILDILRDAGITDIKKCESSCMPPYAGAMHNKFFLIKKGATELVLQSSSNLSKSQAQHAQNMLISRDDTALFSNYLNYWRRLYAGSWTYGSTSWNSDADRARYGSNDLSRVYFFPRIDSDPLAGVLRNVTACEPGNDRVWLEASLIGSANTAHVAAVISQLNRLRGIGCDVKLVVQKEAGRETLLSNGIPSSAIRCDGWSHNKLLLLDAKYAGEWRKAVFVGSYNITQNSNSSANDVMLRIIDGWVTNRYIDQFRALWTNPHACD
jgi:phosphatidylserine/phosphatidylglycerophosphate/cardiolipin synthase-like enzyme